MSLEVKYIDVPPGAQQDMEVDAESKNSISYLWKLPEGIKTGAWATLESFGWPLDGRRDLIPEEPVVGFWSMERTDDRAGILGISRLGEFILGKEEADASFINPPVIDLNFTESFTATGITITFDEAANEWCSRIYIRWYNGQTLLEEGEFRPDASRWTLAKVMEGFTRIQIELLKTSKPGHFAKLQKIELGQVIIFNREELTSLHLVNDVDPTLGELRVDTMNLSIQDKHRRCLYPQENQKMQLFKNGTLVATQYITEGTRQSENGYTFSCQSVIGLLEDDFLGGIYNEEPVANVVDAILEGKPYDLGPFSNARITGYLPVSSRREALQQVAFAIGAIITTQGTEEVRFCSLPEYPSGSFTKSKIFVGGSIKTTPRFYKIEADAHSFTPSQETENLIENEAIYGDDLLLTFEEPHHDYKITGGEIKGSGANWVRICASGVVTITANKYVHSRVRYTRRNSMATDAERNNVQQIDSATLVHNGNVQEILERLCRLAELRQTMTQDAVIEGQYAGQMVTMEGFSGESVRGYISTMESNLTQAGHTAAVTVVGQRCQPGAVYNYAGEIYSGDFGGVY